jgi:hypothetical protein
VTHMDQGNLDVSTLQHYLRGTDFPAEKEEVASNAGSNGAPGTSAPSSPVLPSLLLDEEKAGVDTHTPA